MIKQAIDTFARGRWALPVVLALALAAVVVNESTYQHSHYTLARGIALTDARIQAARTLQVLTDAETNARAFLLSEQAADSAAYRQAPLGQRAARARGQLLRSAARPDDCRYWCRPPHAR